LTPLHTLLCSGTLAFVTALSKLSKLRIREGVGPSGTFDGFLATPAGRRRRREGLEFIEDETQRLAPTQPGTIPRGVCTRCCCWCLFCFERATTAGLLRHKQQTMPCLRLWRVAVGSGDVEAKAQVLLQCGARATPEAVARAARSPQMTTRSPLDLQAALHFLVARGWRIERVHMDVLRTNLEKLVARVLFAELHGCAAARALACCSVKLRPDTSRLPNTCASLQRGSSRQMYKQTAC
jgi:hypothetical protein